MFDRFINVETSLVNQWMETSENYNIFYAELIKLFENNIVFYSSESLRDVVSQQFQNTIKLWIELQTDNFIGDYNPMLLDLFQLSVDKIDYWEIAEYWIDCVLM